MQENVEYKSHQIHNESNKLFNYIHLIIIILNSNLILKFKCSYKDI